MIEENNLKHFIDEDIFILKEKPQPYSASPPEESKVEEPVEVIETPKPQLTSVVPAVETIEEIHDLMVLVLPMNSADKELLIKLLKAIHKSEAEIKLLDSFSDFNGKKFKRLLSFGYLNELRHQVDTSLENYKTLKKGDQEILIASPISSLHTNTSEKTQLWKSLQEMFL